MGDFINRAADTGAAIRAGTSVLLLALPSLAGCASIPQEAVELSSVVGQRLTAVQESHQRFVRGYFQLSRDRVEDFLQRRWIPRFLANFVADASLAEELTSPEPLTADEEIRLRSELDRRLSLEGPVLDTTVAAVKSGLGDAERGQIVLEFAEAAWEQIEAQRRELIGPINELEAQALRELRTSYAELIQAQNAVTAFIQSTHDVSADQDAVLRRLGILEERDRVLEDAAALSDDVTQLTERSGDAEEVLQQLRARLRRAEADEN